MSLVAHVELTDRTDFQYASDRKIELTSSWVLGSAGGRDAHIVHGVVLGSAGGRDAYIVLVVLDPPKGASSKSFSASTWTRSRAPR